MSKPSETKFLFIMGGLVLGTIIVAGVWVGLVLTLAHWILKLWGPS